MREAKDLVVGGKTYSVTPLPAMRALRLWPLVAKGFMVEGAAMMELSADEVEKLTRELFAMARCNGVELLKVVDLEDVPTLMQLLSFAVNVNYSGFSDGSSGSGQPVESGSEG